MRIFIIDDQFTTRQKIKGIIQEINFEDITIIEITNENNFYKQMSTFKFEDSDFFFLDIDLKTYFTGIDLAAMIRKYNSNCFIVFVTAYESKSIEVLNREIFPLGYLLKYKSNSQLFFKIKTLIKRAKLTVIERNKTDHLLLFNNYDGDILIPEDSIYYIATVPGFKNALLVRHSDGEHMVQGKITTIKNQLKGKYFYREMKSFILNLREIQAIYISEGSVQFTNESVLNVGKTGARKVKKFVKESNFDEA